MLKVNLRVVACVARVRQEWRRAVGSAAVIVPAATTMTLSQAKGRHRGEGSRPLGNSRARNTMRPKPGTQSQEEIQAAALAAWSDPGAASSA
jgi:hypothetical protein